MATTITDVKRAAKVAGSHWFESSTMRFFDSRIERRVYTGPGGTYFVSSEQFHGSDGYTEPRRYTVRRVTWEPFDIDTAGEFNKMSREEAFALAKDLAKGKAA